MEFPEIPDNLSELSNEELAALADSLRAFGREALGAEVVTADTVDQAQRAAGALNDVEAHIADRATEDARLASEVEQLSAQFATEPQPAPPDETAVEGDDREDENEDPEDEPEEPVTASSYRGVVRRPSVADVSRHSPETVGGETAPSSVPMRVLPGVSGFAAGDVLTDHAQLGSALINRWNDIRGGGTEKLAVVNMSGRFTPEQTLSDDLEDNMRKFGGLDPLTPAAQQAVTAAICAPVQPYYGINTQASDARPVANSLPTYRAPRGRVSVLPQVRLSSILSQDADVGGVGLGGTNNQDRAGRGVWTAAQDADVDAIKTCAVVNCSTPVVYEIYGIWRCLTVKNLTMLTFPELVAAYVTNLAALQARMAEEALLDAMANSVNTKTVTLAGSAGNFGASINLLTTFIQALAVYREEERMSSDVTVDVWLPRWAQAQLMIDQARMRRTAGRFGDRIPSMADVDDVFAKAGGRVVWTMDDATAWSSVAVQADNAALQALPTSLSFIFSPRGNFRRLDEGNLQIGVTNNGVYRDNASNARNQFSMFYESFEGLIDFGATSYHLTITDFCPNGAQTADVTAIDCTP